MRVFLIVLCFLIAFLLELMTGNANLLVPLVPLAAVFTTLMYGVAFAIAPTLVCGVMLDFVLGRPFFLSTILLVTFLVIASLLNRRFSVFGNAASFVYGFLAGGVWHWGLVSFLWLSGGENSGSVSGVVEFFPYLQTGIIGGVIGFGIYRIVSIRTFYPRSRKQFSSPAPG